MFLITCWVVPKCTCCSVNGLYFFLSLSLLFSKHCSVLPFPFVRLLLRLFGGLVFCCPSVIFRYLPYNWVFSELLSSCMRFLSFDPPMRFFCPFEDPMEFVIVSFRWHSCSFCFVFTLQSRSFGHEVQHHLRVPHFLPWPGGRWLLGLRDCSRGWPLAALSCTWLRSQPSSQFASSPLSNLSKFVSRLRVCGCLRYFSEPCLTQGRRKNRLFFQRGQW